MSAIDELRRLLDERGVAHSDHYFSTTWRDGHGILHLAGEPMADGSLVVDILTPEQAIAATLGSETCEDVGRYCFTCSKCGWTANEPHHAFGGFWPKFCPNCGCKVVSE